LLAVAVDELSSFGTDKCRYHQSLSLPFFSSGACRPARQHPAYVRFLIVSVSELRGKV
jgi:hypothetical protein